MGNFEAQCKVIYKWIVEMIGEELEDPDLFQALKTGTVLCQMMSTMNPDLCVDFDVFAETEEAQAENVECYLNACVELDMVEFFDVDDLLNDGDVRKVLKNLQEFSKIAEEAGFAALPDTPEEESGEPEAEKRKPVARPPPGGGAKSPRLAQRARPPPGGGAGPRKASPPSSRRPRPPPAKKSAAGSKRPARKPSPRKEEEPEEEDPFDATVPEEVEDAPPKKEDTKRPVSPRRNAPRSLRGKPKEAKEEAGAEADPFDASVPDDLEAEDGSKQKKPTSPRRAAPRSLRGKPKEVKTLEDPFDEPEEEKQEEEKKPEEEKPKPSRRLPPRSLNRKPKEVALAELEEKKQREEEQRRLEEEEEEAARVAAEGEEEVVTRGRGETAMLMSWQPPSADSDETLKLENTRLKAQAERSALQVASQTKLREDALEKLKKEKEKNRELEEELETLRREGAQLADAGGSSSELAAKLKEAEEKISSLEEEMTRVTEAASEAEDRAYSMEEKAIEMENAFNQLQMEFEEQETQAAKEVRQLEDDALFLTGELNRYKEEAANGGAKNAGGGDEKLRKEMQQLKDSFAKKEKNLMEEIDELSLTLEKEKQGYEEELDALKSLQSLSGGSDGESSKLKKEVQSLKEELQAEKEASEAEIASLSEQVERLERDLAAKEKEVAKASTGNNNSGRKLSKPVSPREKNTAISPRKVLPSPRGNKGAASPREKPGSRNPKSTRNDRVLNDDLLDDTIENIEVPDFGNMDDGDDAPMKKSPFSSDRSGASGLEGELVALLEGDYAEIDPNVFVEEENRRILTELMKDLDITACVELNGAEFENLADILGVVLEQLDAESPDDFECAESIFNIGSMFFNKSKEFIRTRICEYPIFTEPIFWDDLCIGRIGDAFDVDPDAEDVVKVVGSALQNLGQDMKEWAVPDYVVSEVIQHAAENEDLPDDELDSIMDSVLGGSGGGASSAGGRKSNNASKAPKKLSTHNSGGGTIKKALPTKNSKPSAKSAFSSQKGDDKNAVIRTGPLKFKKSSKWIKATFKLTNSELSYEYVEEGIGEFGDSVNLTSSHSASAGSDQAPGALRNYSFKLSDGKNTIHMLAAKQPEVNEWISDITAVVKGMGGSGAPSGGSSGGGNRSPRGNSRDDGRKGSQPPVRISRTETQSARLVKEGDVKMLVSKRWLRTHVELMETVLVLTYIDPNNNTSQIREDIPLARMLIAPNSPLAPAALKDSSWRIKDGEDEFHLMSNSKSEATSWLGTIKTTRDTLKKKL